MSAAPRERSPWQGCPMPAVPSSTSAKPRGAVARVHRLGRDLAVAGLVALGLGGCGQGDEYRAVAVSHGQRVFAMPDRMSLHDCQTAARLAAFPGVTYLCERVPRGEKRYRLVAEGPGGYTVAEDLPSLGECQRVGRVTRLPNALRCERQ